MSIVLIAYGRAAWEFNGYYVLAMYWLTLVSGWIIESTAFYTICRVWNYQKPGGQGFGGSENIVIKQQLMDPPPIHPAMQNDSESLERNLKIMELKLENEKFYLRKLSGGVQN
jgi:hypothetical protein